MDKVDNNWAVLGGGCFWCLEAVFQRLPGVTGVQSGYAGGNQARPTYEQVCTSATGHAEAIKIWYDPARASYTEILKLFWRCHDPTTPNRQGADYGTQYRSILLTANKEQEKIAAQSREHAQQSRSAKIVTEIKALDRFWPAEGNHQDYFNKNGANAYCAMVISPKLKELGI